MCQAHHLRLTLAVFPRWVSSTQRIPAHPIQLPGNEKGALDSAKPDCNHTINPSFWKGDIFLAQTLMHLHESSFQLSLTLSSSDFENAAGHIFPSKPILMRQQISTKSSHALLPRDLNPMLYYSMSIPGMVHIHTLSIISCDNLVRYYPVSSEIVTLTGVWKKNILISKQIFKIHTGGVH